MTSETASMAPPRSRCTWLPMSTSWWQFDLVPSQCGVEEPVEQFAVVGVLEDRPLVVAARRDVVEAASVCRRARRATRRSSGGRRHFVHVPPRRTARDCAVSRPLCVTEHAQPWPFPHACGSGHRLAWSRTAVSRRIRRRSPPGRLPSRIWRRRDPPFAAPSAWRRLARRGRTQCARFVPMFDGSRHGRRERWPFSHRVRKRPPPRLGRRPSSPHEHEGRRRLGRACAGR